MKKSRRSVCLGIAAVLLLTACGGGYTGGPPAAPSEPPGQDTFWSGEIGRATRLNSSH